MIERDSKTLDSLNPSVKTVIGYYLLIGGLLLGIIMQGITSERFRNAPRSPVESTGQTYPVTIGRRNSRTVYVTSEEFSKSERRQAWSILSLIPTAVGVLLIYAGEQAKKEAQERAAKERSPNI